MKKVVSLLISGLLIFTMLPRTASAAEASWLWPVPGHNNLSRGYYPGHEGIDIAPGGTGAAIVASKSGKVVRFYTGCRNYAGLSTGTCVQKGGCTPNYGTWDGYCNAGYGNGIVIDHGDGTYSHYAHMSSTSGSISLNQWVAQGQIIGYVGASGIATGPHLHFALARSADGSSARFNNNKDAIAYIYELPHGSTEVVADPSMSQYAVYQTNAVLSGRIENPGGQTITDVGLFLYDAGGNRIGTHTEACASDWANRTSVPMWFNLFEEAHITLKAGTRYAYELYGYVGGKLYTSDRHTFMTQGYTLGDVDQNGSINATDALIVLQMATNKIILSTLQKSAADVDAVNGVTAADALLVLQFATRKITGF